MVEVCGGRAYPILGSAGQPACSGPFSFHREQSLASRSHAAKSEGAHAVGADATAHPPLASSGPYLPSLSFAPSARHHLRQEPYAGNPPVRICPGGTERSVSLPRHPTADAEGSLTFSPDAAQLQIAASDAARPPPERRPITTSTKRKVPSRSRVHT